MTINKDEVSEITKDTTRLEAFSDGVFAIAITLLVLDIKVPPVDSLPPGTGLLDALLKQWPVYLAYVTSFITILTMWVSHHNMFKIILRADHFFLMLNGLLLMFITLVPFPTSLLAEYIQNKDQSIAAATYSGTFLIIALTFNMMWWYASSRAKLIHPNIERNSMKNVARTYLIGPVLYLLSFGLAFINVIASLAILIGLLVFYALPKRLGEATTP